MCNFTREGIPDRRTSKGTGYPQDAWWPFSPRSLMSLVAGNLLQSAQSGSRGHRGHDHGSWGPVRFIVQELCESRGVRPGLSVLTSLLVSVDVKLY